MGDPRRLADVVCAQVKLMAEDAADAAARGDRIIVLAPLDDITVVYALIACVGGGDPSSPDARGEYIIQLKVPSDYPAAPPQFIAVTPNGVFAAGTRICVSIGEFHQSEWRPALGLGGFAREIYGAFVCFTPKVGGIGVRVVGLEERRKLALESRAWNEKNMPEVLAALRAAAPAAAIEAIDRAAVAPVSSYKVKTTRAEAAQPAAGAARPAAEAEAARPMTEITPPADYSAFFG